MLLAAAVSVLVGLQGAAIQRTIRDRNVQQAMLAARRVLAAVEVSEEQLTISPQTDVPMLDLLQNINAPEPRDERERRALQLLRGTLAIEDWTIPLPKIEENPMRRVDLKITWSSEPQDFFAVTLFIPAPQNDEETG